MRGYRLGNFPTPTPLGDKDSEARFLSSRKYLLRVGPGGSYVVARPRKHLLFQAILKGSKLTHRRSVCLRYGGGPGS